MRLPFFSCSRRFFVLHLHLDDGGGARMRGGATMCGIFYPSDMP